MLSRMTISSRMGWRTWVVLVLLATGGAFVLLAGGPGDHLPPTTRLGAMNTRPLAFELNVGQSDPAVRFLTHSANATLFFTDQEVVVALSGPPPERATGRAPTGLSSLAALAPALLAPAQVRARARERGTPVSGSVVHLRFIAANADAVLTGSTPGPGRVSYFMGNDPTHWHSGLVTYAGITYQGLYPGVDLAYTSQDARLKGSYTIAPGADPLRIRWRYDGATRVQVDAAGNLIIALGSSPAVTVTEQAPIAWQDRAGQRTTVRVGYRLLDDGSIGFTLGPYDPTRALTVDPYLVFATFLGGSGGDGAEDIAVDPAGNVYVTGYTISSDFPVKDPEEPFKGRGTAFVAKFTTDGTPVYATYLGGSVGGSPDCNRADCLGYGIAVDAAGNAYVAGFTMATDFPTTAGAYQRINRGGEDSVVTKLSPDGATLLYSTYVGSSVSEYYARIAVDNAGAVYITGETGTRDYPLVNPLQRQGNLFVTKLNTDGSALVYSTYLGGTDRQYSPYIAVDGNGQAYVTGTTASTDFPTAHAYQRALGGGSGDTDAFVVQLNPQGSALGWATYLGGSGPDHALGIALDGEGNVYVTGGTQSANFPLAGPLQASYGGGVDQYDGDAFVTKLNPQGSALVYSTYIGGSRGDSGSGIAVDRAGNTYISGMSNSSDFPTKDPLVRNVAGGVLGFLLKLNATGSDLIYSTFYGGPGREAGARVAVDGAGNGYVAGVSWSDRILMQPANPPFQAENHGPTDALILKFSEQAPAAPTPLPTAVLPGAGSRTFPETGQTTTGLFLDYWTAHGGLAQQGYPISPILGEVSDLDHQPYTVQYFERAVFEYHPENAGSPYEVLLSQLGTYRYQAKYGTTGAPGQHASNVNPRFFAETQHTLGGTFRAYWESHGGLAQQGYPLSDEFPEASDLDPGKSYTVQYFERAVFEWHPENVGTPYEVLLTQLGTLHYRQKHGNP